MTVPAGLVLMAAGLVCQPLPWADERLRSAHGHGPLPLYGDPVWAALPPGDPRRWGAVIASAEVGRDYRSPERIALDFWAFCSSCMCMRAAATASMAPSKSISTRPWGLADIAPLLMPVEE